MHYRARSFTLVLTLLLAVLITVTTGALALRGSVESLAASQYAEEFDHELAVGNFVACLPQLLTAARANSHGQKKGLRLELRYDSLTIAALVHSERDKLNLQSTVDRSSLDTRLRDLARQNGLVEANVRVRLLAKEYASTKGQRLFWFSQIVHPTQYDEVFPWSINQPVEIENQEQKSWSDLVTFWNGEGQEVLSLNLETKLQSRPSRRWYVVVSVTGQHAKVLYQGPCS